MKLIEEGIESCCGEFNISLMLGWMCRCLVVDVVLSMAVLGCILMAMPELSRCCYCLSPS